LEGIKILRGIKKTSDLPIIAFSAYAMEEDIKSCLRMGFTDYIVKPLHIPEFLNKIDKFLD
jgi:CheY-like chemotaxis protein